MQVLCKNCEFSVKPFFSLGRMPLVNRFLKHKKEFAHEQKFDLTVGFCPRCFLVQLTSVIPPENLFRNYIYFSSTSSSFLRHCEDLARRFVRQFNLNLRHLVLEIASNDGAQLNFFKKLGVRVLGIDPARNIAKIANARGIKTLPKFFDLKLAQNLKKRQGLTADLVFGANVLAHVPRIRDFAKGVKEILSPKGRAVFEFPYIKGLFENKFDTIYHEHVFYFSLLALCNLFKGVDLEIYDVEMTSMQGGSLMIFISHPGKFKPSARMKTLLRREKRSGFEKLETYKKIEKNIGRLKVKLVSLLHRLKMEGKTIAAYGAAAKGTVLVNYFGIGQYLDFIADKSEVKQGLYVPGTCLTVYPPNKIYLEKPDYLLVLPWNIVDEIMRQYGDFRRHGGKFIIPVPKVKIV